MRRVLALGFEGLEARKLLTASHHAAAHAAPAAVVVVPVGTLAVENHAATTAMGALGGSTTTTPVAGSLDGLGKVRGAWDKSLDTFGDYAGPDTLRLRDSRGSFVLAFNTSAAGKVRHHADGTVSYEIADHVRGGTGAYARATGVGTITLVGGTGQAGVLKLILGPGKT